MEGFIKSKINLLKPDKKSSYEELQKKYEDLQIRAVKFLSVEQQLINSRNRLDYEIAMHKRMHDFNKRALKEMSDCDFVNLVAEAIVDIFEVEIGIVLIEYVGEKGNSVFGLEGISVSEYEKKEIKNFASILGDYIPQGNAVNFISKDFISLKPVIPLNQAFGSKFTDDNNIKIIILGGILEKSAILYDALDSARGVIFGVFSQQVHARFVNRKKNKTIMDQVAKINFANRALRESEKRYRLLFEGSPTGIVIIEEKTKIIKFANDSLCKMLGYTNFELCGMEISDLNYEDKKNKNDLKFEENIWKGEKNEVPVIKKDGSVIYTDISYNRIKLDDDELIAAFVVDITLKKDTTEKLVQNNKELKKINSELDNFVYSISHDLRAPLLAMKGLLSLMEDKESGNCDLETYLTMANESVEKMDETIKEILEYSRNSRLDVLCEEINIKNMVKKIFDGVRFYYLEDIDLQFDIDEKVKFFSDKVRIGTVLKNLITNSIKYKKHTEEKSYVKISYATSGDDVFISVRDNGEGIAEKHIEKIFDMFYRASNKVTGTGLGLYICKEIITKLGGKIEVASEKGKFTEFKIFLKNNSIP